MERSCGDGCNGCEQCTDYGDSPADAAAPTLTEAARRVLAASEKATAGCAVQRWAGQENGYGEEFGVELDAALCALRSALTEAAQ